MNMHKTAQSELVVALYQRVERRAAKTKGRGMVDWQGGPLVGVVTRDVTGLVVLFYRG